MTLFRYPIDMEFGIQMIGGILYPFYARMQSNLGHCRVEMKYDLPYCVWHQFCEEFALNNDPEAKVSIPVKLDYSQTECFKTTLHTPYFDPPVKGKYIAILPVFAEFYCCNGYRTTCALRASDWRAIKEFANSKGYKVVMLGLEPDMGIYDKLGQRQPYLKDESEYADQIIWKLRTDCKNGWVTEQLPYITNANLVIATGGACALPLMFGTKSIILDNDFYNEARSIDDNLLDHYMRLCSLVVSMNPQIHSMPYRPNDNRLTVAETVKGYEASRDFVLDRLSHLLCQKPLA